MDYSLWKNVNFSTFWTSCFYSLERWFFVLEYRKRHFTGLYCLKNESWKNGHFWSKTTGKPRWRNVSFSTFSTSCFYSLERRLLVLEYRKWHFPCLYCLKKSWKIVNFSTIWTSCFYRLKRRFFVLEYRKRRVLGLYRLKKSWKNNDFCTKTMG